MSIGEGSLYGGGRQLPPLERMFAIAPSHERQRAPDSIQHQRDVVKFHLRCTVPFVDQQGGGSGTLAGDRHHPAKGVEFQVIHHRRMKTAVYAFGIAAGT